MNVMHELNHEGDTQHHWDPQNLAEVEIARDLFNRMTRPASRGGKGYLAFSAEGREHGTQLREFDPDAERIVYSPPLAGG